MGKALVIKNADFSANRITTVTFNDVKCTGVSFDETSIELSALGTAQIGYTVMPSDTTDTVILETSDPTVISISGTVCTVEGIGSCHLTLKCGAYKAVCEAIVDIYEQPVYIVGTVSEYDPSYVGGEYKSIDIMGDSSTRVSCVGQFLKGYFSEKLDYYPSTFGFNVEDITAIKIPQNAKKIHVHCESAYQSDTSSVVYFVNADESYTPAATNRTLIPMLAKEYLPCPGSKIIDMDVDIPNGVTGFVCMFRVYPSISNDIDTEEELISYVTNTLKASIHYLPESDAET